MADAQLSQKRPEEDPLPEPLEDNVPSSAIKSEPWTRSTTQTPVAEGITYHQGPDERHFGLHVSPDLNETIDPVWREPNGWYEGREQWPVVAISFPDHFEPSDVETAHESAKINHAEAYQEFTSKMVDQPNKHIGYSAFENYYGAGISLFETPVDTYVQVSPELNEKVDPDWREPNGLYNADNQSSIVALSFPDRFDLSELAAARQDAKDRYPDIFEKVIGQMTPPRIDEDENLDNTPETSSTKPAPDLKDLMAAFGPDPQPAGRDADKASALPSPQQTTDASPTESPAASVQSPQDVSTAAPNLTASAEPTAQIDPPAHETSNSVEVSSAKPAPDLKDLIAAFDSDAEPTGKTVSTPDAETDETPDLVEAKADTTAAPVADNTTEKRVVPADKYESPSTPQNSEPAAPTIDATKIATQQSSTRQERQNDQQQNSNQAPQTITAAGIIAGAVASGFANAFRRKAPEKPPTPADAEPGTNQPLAPSPAQPAQNTPNAKTAPVAPAEAAPTTDATVLGPSNPVGGSLALRRLLNDFRPDPSESISQQQATPAVGDNAPAQPGSARALLDKFNASRMQPRRDADQLLATERAAATAVNSFEALEKADSSAILTRIREAAEASPGGMKEVISEMRPGGAYEDLRKEFNAVLDRDEHFSAAYEHASSALDAYADQRQKAAPFLQKGNTGVLARLETMDEKIIKAASELPGKEDGKSTLDEALEKTRDAVMNMINSVRNAFSQKGPSASPSFSP